MCGICGYLGIDDDALIARMTQTLVHRGPDDVGYYRDGDMALGHRRLKVIDLEGGRQPMQNRDQSLVLVFNGEIYNYSEIRDTLQQHGHTFQTASDTEVLLQAYEAYGADALEKLNGMFAFAVYDRAAGSLFLARDRVGIKPLYYLALPGCFLFASEAKALLCHRSWSPSINARAIHDYLALRYVPGDRSVIHEIRRLPAGHYLTYRDGRIEIQKYWEVPQDDRPDDRRDEECLEELSELMARSVKRRMISDVPFGAYLSGGLDSSTIVGAMAGMVSEPIKTFAVGFDYEHDELNEAAATAKFFGCDHHEIACRAEDVSLLPEIVYHLDEPMGDAIIIPMFQLSREAKRHVTVILTGEGADEIFGGYLFHKVMQLGESYRRGVPRALRDGLIAPLLSAVPASLMNMAFRYPAQLGQRGKQKALDYLHLLDPARMGEAYRHLISLFDKRDLSDLYTSDFRALLREQDSDRDGLGQEGAPHRRAHLDRLLSLQFDHWLPDNMLLRQDKTGMAHSIEGRVPFLDHELIEFALKLPTRMKIRRMTGKYLLRRYAAGFLPPKVAHRKKMPFYVPVENYFEHPEFRKLMDDVLGEDAVRRRGIFRPEAVERLRGMMHKREFLFVKQVFSLIVLELWFRTFCDSPVGTAQEPSAAVMRSTVFPGAAGLPRGADLRQ